MKNFETSGPISADRGGRSLAMSPRSLLPRLAGLAAAAIVVGLSPAARAGSEGFAVSLYGLGAAADVDRYHLHIGPSADEPGVLVDNDLRLNGWGRMIGGGLRATVLGSSDGPLGRTRVGLGIGAFGMSGLELLADPLPAGLTADIGSMVGARFDLSFGRELAIGPKGGPDAEFGFQNAHALYPYIELQMVFDIVQAEIQIHSPDLGLLGSTAYNTYSFGLGPRAGVAIPLTSDIFIDLGVYASIFGMERVGGFAGLGVWDR
jgi:hypothetical protein